MNDSKTSSVLPHWDFYWEGSAMKLETMKLDIVAIQPLGQDPIFWPGKLDIKIQLSIVDCDMIYFSRPCEYDSTTLRQASVF